MDENIEEYSFELNNKGYTVKVDFFNLIFDIQVEQRVMRDACSIKTWQ